MGTGARLGGVRFVLSLRGLPPRVALFMLRARRHALRTGDAFSVASAIRPAELAALVRLARGRAAVAELGTGTGVSAIALALADRRRRIATYDPCSRPEREAYLALARPDVRERIDFREQLDSDGPRAGETVELLFIDSEHYRESILRAFRAWRGALGSGAVVVFHDYDHPSYPGVREAVDEIGLSGSAIEGLFVARVP